VANSILTDIGNVNYILDERWLKCEARQQVHGHVVFVCRPKMRSFQTYLKTVETLK